MRNLERVLKHKKERRPHNSNAGFGSLELLPAASQTPRITGLEVGRQ